ncbi:cytochrome P450 monooxygenase-like protein [Delphinella strobiligena]|nr:cytochrome P450 monooxygenase-like protein [Delphinella strobiligena]
MDVSLGKLILRASTEAISSTKLWLAVFGIIASYRLALIIYNAFLHPLARCPGPFSRAVSHLPSCWCLWSGYDHLYTKALHDQYGPVVRVSPSALSFNSPRAWQDIYGFSKDRKQIPKDVYFYLPENIHAQRSLINANDSDHARMRKLLAHAFSAQVLREQEEILTQYFDLLINRLKQQIDGPSSGKVDFTQWFNFFTFDLIGDLALGKPFGMLEAARAPDFMESVMKSSKGLIPFWTGNLIPIYGIFLSLYARLPGSTARARMKEFALRCTKQRLSEKRERKDFMSYVLKYNDERGMTNAEIGMTTRTLLNAGTETTATTLTACVWLILKHPEVLKKVTKEVRDNFDDMEELNLQSTSPGSLPYLFAVIEETMRVYPPLGGLAFARMTDQSTEIDGNLVPQSTRVSVPHYTSSRSAANWTEPASFVPERWLDDQRFSNDKKGAFQPFSTGLRVCIGKNLAYAELTSIMSRLLFSFDMTLCEESISWGDHQKTYNFWEKPPLMVKLALSDKMIAR